MTGPSKKIVPFQQVLDALLNMNEPFPAQFLHRFSDISPADLQALEQIWSKVETRRRGALMEDLESVHEADTLLSYDDVAIFALKDPDPRVRIHAIRLLWESEKSRLAPMFGNMLETDENEQVRAAAASALGKFIYLGELEKIDSHLLHQVEERLLKAARSNQDDLIRRRAIESLGYSSRSEAKDLINEAYEKEDPDWLASALFAMGRSADTTWNADVLDMFDHPEIIVQIEAVRAAGSLALVAAREPLIEMLEEGIEDDELRQAAVWSLSEIGGDDVQDTLEALLEETEDDEEIEMIEDALENLEFTNSADQLGFMDLDPNNLTDEIKRFISDNEDEDNLDPPIRSSLS